ncbi:MAG: cytidine deaminase [Bacteroidales bacterium]|nr:cytidine deaminase [Bacteroidales bacterium]
MIQRTFSVAYTEFSSNEELTESDRILIKMAWEAAEQAYAPYSRFFVGAALRLENGTIFTGNNQENSAYPSGLCAERVAIFAASSQLPGIAIETIAVVAKTEVFSLEHPVTPCGGCRQVMAEYENLSGKPIRTILQGSNSITWIVEGVNNFLPLMFEGNQLKK